MRVLTPTLTLLLSLSEALAYNPISRSQRQRRGSSSEPSSITPLEISDPPELEKRRYISYNERKECIEAWNPLGTAQCAHHLWGAKLHCQCCPSSDEGECRHVLSPSIERRAQDDDEDDDEEAHPVPLILAKRQNYGHKSRYVDCESERNPEGWATCTTGDDSCQCMKSAAPGSHGVGQWSTGDRKIGFDIDRYVEWFPKHPGDTKWKHWGPGKTIGTDEQEEWDHDGDGKQIKHANGRDDE